MSNSQEEEIARDYICFGNPDCTVVVLDATCLERNLNLVFQVLEITNKVVVCVNLLDEAQKKGIHIDFKLLSKYLGVPVVGTTARKPKSLNKLLDTIYDVCTKRNLELFPNNVKYFPVIEECIDILKPDIDSIILENNLNPYLSRWVCIKIIDGNENIISSIEKHLNIDISQNNYIKEKIQKIKQLLKDNDIDNSNLKDKMVSSIVFKAESICNYCRKLETTSYNSRDRKIDKILTSRITGFPIMIIFLGVIFWITIYGANYPSELLSNFFGFIEDKLLYLFEYFNAPAWLSGLLISGMFKTLTWVVAVMLPPMAIFFPLFTLLEDLGYLPRIAFNLDKFFKKACTTGKQALTMCMGFGCNAAGVVGCRIINSPRERLIAILTNSLVPCNRKISFFNNYCNSFYWKLFYWIFIINNFNTSCIVCYLTWNNYDNVHIKNSF